MSVNIRYRKTKEGSYSAYLDIYHKGKRTYHYPEIYVSKDYTEMKNYLKEDKEKIDLIERMHDKIKLEIAEGQFGFVPASVRNADFITYFENLSTEKESKGYIFCLNKLKLFANERGGKLPFSTINTNTMKDFIAFLSKEDISNNTALYYLKLINVAFKKAIDEKILSYNPLKKLPREFKPKGQHSQREYLTIEELRAMKATSFHANPQIAQAFMFGCFTGLRISDLCKLKHSDIEDGVIKYRQEKSEKEFHHLPLNETAKEILASLPKPPPHTDLVFWDLPGNSYSGIQLNLWAAKAGVKKQVTWQVSRHTFAVLFLNNNGDIYTLKKLLGHSSVTVTEIYAKIANPKKAELINNLPKL